VQTFSYKTAKLAARTIVEVDRRWVRATRGKGKQVHIDYNLIHTINYWVTQSRGVALTGHLVIRDRQGRKLALQCSSFGMEKDFLEFLRAVSATLSAISETRPDVSVVREPTSLHQFILITTIAAGLAVIGGATLVFDHDDMPTKVGGVAFAMLFAVGYVLFKFGPLRKKQPSVAPADLAREIGG
jgi:hypothetical protein